MPDLIKLALVFALIVMLLRWKLKVGYVMLVASGSLVLLYLMDPVTALRTARDAAIDPVTLELTVALMLIRMLEMVLREKDTLKEMMGSFRRIFGNLRAVIVSMPLLIGMLPSVGGAYFSAPMVDEATRDIDMSREEKAFVNYWFRHPWEYVLPLYPGILLASALTGIELRGLIMANAPFATLMIVLGFALSMRQAGGKRGSGAPGAGRLTSFLPVVLVLLMVIVLKVRLYMALGAVVAGLLVFHRYGRRGFAGVLRHGFSLDVVVLIFGVMLFKHTMESAGAVEGISGFFEAAGVPLIPALVLLPLLTGALTGLTIGFVGATFPLLVSLPGGDSLAAVALAFTSGFAGVLLSPVHVCLILTKEYFHAALGGLYMRLALPSAMLIAAGLIEYLLLR